MIKNKKGQAIIIILLLMAVALTIGLSISSQTATDIKISTQLEESERAYAAAEAGIEKALATKIGGSGTLDIGSSYNVTIETFAEGHTIFFFPKKISQDDTKQVWLAKHNEDGTLDESSYYDGSTLEIYWGDSSDLDPKPAAEATLVFYDTDYDIKKYTFDPDSSRASANNFSVADSGTYTFDDKTFYFKGTVDLDSPCPSSTCKRLALRLRLLYNTTQQPFAVKPESGKTLYSQGKQIESVGTAGNTTRKVVIFESYPSLPGIFDYVLFSGTNLTKE